MNVATIFGSYQICRDASPRARSALQLKEVSRLDGEDEEVAQNSIQPWHPTIARGLRVKYDPGTWGRRATNPPWSPVPSQSQSRRWACSSISSVPAGSRKIRLRMAKPGTGTIIPSIEGEHAARHH